MDYFTSDLHIGHDKEFIWKARGFNSVEEHDTQILKNWNNTVTYEDTVYVLGDLCMGGNEKEWNRIYENLNGKIIFIVGNHDTANKVDRYIFNYEMECWGLAAIYKYSKKYRFYLSHYPTYTANYDDDKSHPLINLYGHTHQKEKFFNNNPYMYNVALDAHNCTPISIDDIIKDILKYKGEK